MRGATISGMQFDPGGDNTITLSRDHSEITFVSPEFATEWIILGEEEYSIPVDDIIAMHKQWKSGELGRTIIHQEGYYMTTQIWSVSGVVSIIFISMLGAWILRKFSFRGTVRWFIRLVYKPAKEKVAEAEAVWKEEKSKGE